MEALMNYLMESEAQRLKHLERFISHRLILGIGRTKQATLWFYYLNYCLYHNIQYESKTSFRRLVKQLGGIVYWDKKEKKHYIQGIAIREKPPLKLSEMEECQCSVCTSQDSH